MGQGFQSRLGTQTHHWPSTQAQPPVFLGRIGVWKEHVPAQINGSKPFCSVPQRCMHEQAPSHHTTISKESGLLLNAREHRGSQDTISQVSTKAQNGTSIYVMKTETITMWSQILCIPALWMPNVLTQTEIKSSPLIEEQVTKYSERKKQTNKFSSGIRRFHLLQLSLFLRGEMFLKLNHFPPLFDHFQIPKMSPKK